MKNFIIFITLFSITYALNAQEKPIFKKGDCIVEKQQITNTEFPEYNDQQNKHLNKRKILKVGKLSYLYKNFFDDFDILELHLQNGFVKIKCK